MGTLITAEAGRQVTIYPEIMNSDIKVWAGFVKEGHLAGPEEVMKRIDELTIDQLIRLRFLVVHDTPPRMDPISLTLPVKMNKPFHQPHLENFFDTIRGRAELNCPAEVGYETAVAVLKVNEAVEASQKLKFEPEEFKV